MTHVYQQILHRMTSFYSRAERTALQLLIQRLTVAAGGMERIGNYRVLVVQNGSRDSFYMLTALRAAQLSIAGRNPATFNLRVATPRLTHTTQWTLENIHRGHSALFLYDDPRVELLMTDNREVVPFNHKQAYSLTGLEASRMDGLVLGHLRPSDDLSQVGDDGYLAMAEFYRHMIRWEAGVDSLVSCDSPRQQKQFMSRLQRASRKIGHAVDLCEGFDGLFAQLERLGDDIYTGFCGQEGHGAWRPENNFESRRPVGYIGIHDLITGHPETNHWPLLNEFLRVKTDGLTVSAHENEYLTPLLSAHMHGLNACYLQGRSYEAGYSEYVQRILMILHRRLPPEQACGQARKLFGPPSAMAEHRIQADLEAQKMLGLNETQLVCMLAAPFAGKGAGLEPFLRSCHPGMLVAMPDLHKAMRGKAISDQVTQWMTDVSGLSLNMLGRVYQSSIAWLRPQNPVAVRRRGVVERADNEEAGRGGFYERTARH